MSWKKSIVLILAAVFLLSAALLGGCGKAARAGKYKIGVIVSLSGPAAPLGQSEQRSINLLKKQLDKQGGINGTPVEFLVQDDESDPSKANIAASKLIGQEKVCAIIGCSSTGSTLAIMPTAEKQMVPVVAMAAGTQVTQPPKKWVFSVAPGTSKLR
jgi:branched-chain amino acid transport system substrate-binding protein